MLNLWINVYLTLKMCCSFSWHNKQSVCAGWDMARLAKFFAFQTENPKFREGYEKTLCHWLGYCFGLASHWWFFFFFGGHEPRLQWYQLVSGVGECPVLWRHKTFGEFSSISTLTCCQQEGRPVALPNRRGEFITTWKKCSCQLVLLV